MKRINQRFVNRVSLLLFVLSPFLTYGKVVRWDQDTAGVWDQSAENWKTNNQSETSFQDGDEVEFGLVKPAPVINIDEGGVSPASITFVHYGTPYTFTGGNITGDSGIRFDPFGCEVLFDGYQVSLSFTGDVEIERNANIEWSPVGPGIRSFGQGEITINNGSFGFTPSTSAELDNPIRVLSNGGVLYGNEYADWSRVSMLVDGQLELEGGFSFNGLDLVYNSDQTLILTSHYSTTDATHFTGRIASSSFRNISIYVGVRQNWKSYVEGDGEWEVNSIRKVGPGTLVVDAPKVFGNTLHVDEGMVELREEDHTVKALYVHGIEQKDPGTYGSSDSGAEYVNDDVFSGPGMITLLDLPEVSLRVVESEAHEESGAPALVQIIRSNSTGNLKVFYETEGTASEDDFNEPLLGEVTIPDGQLTYDLILSPVDDGLYEDVKESIYFSIAPGDNYKVHISQNEAIAAIIDEDLPLESPMQFELPMTSQLNGLRPHWDKSFPGSLTFDAIHRTLLVRFPGIAKKLKQLIESGKSIDRLELILPFAGTEIFPDGYVFRKNFGVEGKWETQVPRWHVQAYALKRLWSTEDGYAPTYNATIKDALYWEQFGAQGDEDRHPEPVGVDEVSSVNPSGLIDMTSLLIDSAYGDDLGERLINFENHGIQLRKLEAYDFAFRGNNSFYEWGIDTGGRAIHIEKPLLSVSFSPVSGNSESVSFLEAPPIAVVSEYIRQTGAGGSATAVLPSPDDFEALKRHYKLVRPDWMPAWQYDRIQDLIELQETVSPQNNYFFPDSYEDYLAWLDHLHHRPPRHWEGFAAGEQLVTYLLYKDVLPEPVNRSVYDYWYHYLMPDRPTLTRSDFEAVGPTTSGLVHPQAIWGESSDEYYSRTVDWRGNSSFFRSGYTRTMSTQNFNFTATLGALVGGSLIDSNAAMEDGKAGLESLLYNLWSWAGGSMQESIDHYYLSHTLHAIKVIHDFAPDSEIRNLARSVLIKINEELATSWHPKVRRFISTSSRTSVVNLFVQQEGINHALHTLSPTGALHDVEGILVPDGMSAMGQDLPAGLVARLAMNASFGDSYWSDIIDNKTLPYELRSSHSGFLKTSYFGNFYGIASVDSSKNLSIPNMGHWLRRDDDSPDIDDVGTMLIRHGVNETNMLFDEDKGGIVPHQGGELATFQAKNRMIVFGSPNNDLKGFRFNPPSEINSIQVSLALYNFEQTPSWKIYVDGVQVDVTQGPVSIRSDQRITIDDGISYLGIIPLPATDLGRNADVVLSIGPTQDMPDHGSAAPALLIENYNYRLNAVLDLDSLDLDALDSAFNGYVVEMGDQADYGSFENFQQAVHDATMIVDQDFENKLVTVEYLSSDDEYKVRFNPLIAGEPRSLALRQFNGEKVKLPWTVERDSTLSQIGINNSPEVGQTTLTKNDTQLILDWWRRGHLVADPENGNYSASLVSLKRSSFDFVLPGGKRIFSSSSVQGPFSVLYNETANQISVDYNFSDADASSLAEKLRLEGFSNRPTVLLNDLNRSVVVETQSGNNTWSIGLPSESNLPWVSITSETYILEEASEAGLIIHVSRSSGEDTLLVKFETSGDASTNDYQISSSGTLRFAEGELQKTIVIVPIDDTESESDELLHIKILDSPEYLSSPTARQLGLTLIDDDGSLPVVSIQALHADSAEETQFPAELLISLSKKSNIPTEVYLAYSGTANASDFAESLPDSVTILPNRLEERLILTPVDDVESETLETLSIGVREDPKYLIYEDGLVEIALEDNDREIKEVVWANESGGLWDEEIANWEDELVYYEGDRARFTSLGVGKSPLVSIPQQGIFPKQVLVDHYAHEYEFVGGYLRGEGSLLIRSGRLIIDGQTRSFTHRGGTFLEKNGRLTFSPNVKGSVALGLKSIDVRSGQFAFFPKSSSRLTNSFIFGPGKVTFLSNRHAIWGAAPIYILPGTTVEWGKGDRYLYPDLIVDMAGEVGFEFDTHYQSDQVTRFAGIVYGPEASLTISVVGPGPQIPAQVGGDGYWDLKELIKVGNGPLQLNIPEAVGRTLKIDDGIIILNREADTQTVVELWLGGKQMTVAGTYGSTDSDADFLDNRYFAGPGVVTLVNLHEIDSDQNGIEDSWEEERSLGSGNTPFTAAGVVDQSLLEEYYFNLDAPDSPGDESFPRFVHGADEPTIKFIRRRNLQTVREIYLISYDLNDWTEGRLGTDYLIEREPFGEEAEIIRLKLIGEDSRDAFFRMELEPVVYDSLDQD